MPKAIYTPTVDQAGYILTTVNGGTGANNATAAASTFGLMTEAHIGTENGAIRLVNGKIPSNYVESLLPSNTCNLDGPLSVEVNSVTPYAITDYDRYGSYTITAASGSVSRVGGVITYTAPATIGVFGFVVNGRTIPISVAAIKPAKPAITSPLAGVMTNAYNTVITSSAFYISGPVATHLSSDWQVATDASFVNIVASVTNSVTALTTYAPAGLLAATVYYARVRYNTATYGSSDWSIVSSFTTKVYTIPNHEMAKLVASDKLANDYFGWSVSISGDGSRVVVGAYLADPGGTSDAGAAYIFLRTGTTWTQEAKIFASDKVASDQFGTSVSISSDGSRVVVGALYSDPSGITNAGAAYIYLRTGTTWSQEAKLTASDKAASDYFGSSVSISSDGSRVVVGAYASDPGGTSDAGAVYIYLRTGTTWTQEAKITASDKLASDYFGISVSITSDGSRVVVGADSSSPGGTSDAGAAYIFLRTGTTWTQEAKIFASDKVASDQFGTSVSISSDGSRVVVGAYASDPEGITNAGAAYIFLRTGTTWTQEAKLTASDKATIDYFGISVAISGDGTRVVVGADGSDPSGITSSGAAYIYLRTGTTWTQEAKIIASDKAASDHFGQSVAITSDGTKIVVGADSSSPGGTSDAGAAYIFE